jgi:quercetin dioxygenase-like cupin family protein
MSLNTQIARVLPVAVAGALSLFATTAFAGECPADKRGVNVTKPSTMAAKDVTDVVLASIDVAKEQGIADRQFRLRKLEVKPGGVVPWHSHGERPALIYIVEGEILEYSSDCAVPILHKAGEVSAETKGVAHWWKNEGAKTVVLISADLLKDKMDKNM